MWVRVRRALRHGRRRRRVRGPRSSRATGTTTRSDWRRSRPCPASCSSRPPPRAARAAAQGARAAALGPSWSASSRCSSSRYSRSGSTARPGTACSTGFFQPSDPKKVILSFEAQDSLRRLAALVPAGQGVVGRPENGSPAHVAAVRHQHALPLDPDPHDRRRDRHRHRLRRHGEPARRVRGHGPARHPLGHRLDPRLLARPARAVLRASRTSRTSTASRRSGPTATTRSTGSPAAGSGGSRPPPERRQARHALPMPRPWLRSGHELAADLAHAALRDDDLRRDVGARGPDRRHQPRAGLPRHRRASRDARGGQGRDRRRAATSTRPAPACPSCSRRSPRTRSASTGSSLDPGVAGARHRRARRRRSRRSSSRCASPATRW